MIAAQINQSVQANIHFWACSWWGPGGFEDNIIKNHILTHAQAGELKYAIMYESTGRLGSFSSPDYSRLVPDVQYLSDNYFGNPNYLKIDGRPVIFIYLTRVYFRNQGDAALADLRVAFPNLYIVADDVFGRYYSSSYASKWDAVTAYDVYGQTLGSYGSTQAALNRLEDILNDEVRFNYEKYLQVDMAFHTAILEASHNELLAQIGHTMRHAVQTARQADIHNIAILSASQPFHDAVMRAIARKDPEGAYSASREMFDQVWANLPENHDSTTEN